MSVLYRARDFKTSEELRSVVMKRAINQNMQNEHILYDPMYCRNMNSPTDAAAPDWGTREAWSSAAAASATAASAWNSATLPRDLADVNYANSNGKGKGDAYSQRDMIWEGSEVISVPHDGGDEGDEGR